MSPISKAPRTLDEFASDWVPFIRRHAQRCHVAAAQIDDFVQEVVLFVCEKNELDTYDPSISKFSTWLGALVYKRSMSFRSKAARQRSELYLNAPAYREDSEDAASLLIDPQDCISLSQSVENVVSFARKLEESNPVLASLFGVLLAELAEPQATDRKGSGTNVRKINRRRVARKAGVPLSRLNHHLDALAEVAREEGFHLEAA